MAANSLTQPVPAAIVRFGVFEADFSSEELRRNGVRVKIQDLPFRALKLLVSQPGEVVTKEKFRQALWPEDVFVDFDRGISSAVKRLRDAIGDSAENPLFVETIDRRGYRWIAPIQPVSAARARVSGEGSEDSDRHRPLRWGQLLTCAAVLLVLLVAGVAVRRQTGKRAGDQAGSTSLPPARDGSGLPARAANREAENLYLEGRFYWNKRTPESLRKAVDAFTQSIVHDPNYALAYVGLADCYNLLREYSAMPDTEAYPRAFAAARKAVELDEHSSEAHASLAFVSFFGMWDVAMADREFRRSIELDPQNGVAHHWYASYLLCLRRYRESLTEIERAQALDPGSSSVLADKADILFLGGNTPEAMALLKHLVENEPSSVSVHRYLKYIYATNRDYGNFLAEWKKEAELIRDEEMQAVVEAGMRAWGEGGDRAMLEAIRSKQRALYDRGVLPPYVMAETYSLMGDKEEALQLLNVAYDKHSDRLIEIETNPIFAGLHNEPGFKQLLSKAGLPPIR